MSNPSSTILIIGYTSSKKMDMGANYASTIEHALSLIHETKYRVIAIDIDSEPEDRVTHFFRTVRNQLPHCQIIAISKVEDTERVKNLINQRILFKLLPSYQDPQLVQLIQEAMGKSHLLQQNLELNALVHEQNRKLIQLSTELEERVKKRQTFLREANKRLNVTNQRTEALQRALIAVYRATSTSEVEIFLKEALNQALELSWIRILFSGQSMLNQNIDSQKYCAVYKASLVNKQDSMGEIFYAREKPFSRGEKSFLQKITDTVALAIDRLRKLDETETLKQQWEATFDAISSPVSLINKNYEILRTNKTFVEKTGFSLSEIIGQKCHQVLFSLNSPCKGCHLGHYFQLAPQGEGTQQSSVYQVSSQEIQMSHNHPLTFVNIYRDKTEQITLERQVLESTKMREMGTIGSSIAHELNNPLAGMLSFLQLIKMDLEQSHPIYPDIAEMENGVKKCKDIVENLLGFSRASHIDAFEEVDLRDVLERSKKIIELQTRSRGIELQLELPHKPLLLTGHFNLLSQAFCNILQNSIESIVDKSTDEEGFKGEISIQVEEQEDSLSIEIVDNGLGFSKSLSTQIFNPLFTTKNQEKHPGLGLTLAYQIVQQHKGYIEFFSQPNDETRAKIHLSRPVL